MKSINVRIDDELDDYIQARIVEINKDPRWLGHHMTYSDMIRHLIRVGLKRSPLIKRKKEVK